MPRRLTYLILSAAGIGLLFFAWNSWRNSRTLSDAEMLSRLPSADAVVLAIDFAQLRQSSIFHQFADSKVAEEPDYQTFVRNSGFDYKKDLDQTLVSFSPSGNFFVVRGRFDWNKLENYAKQNGGSCYNQLCHMPGSTPERKISFLPLSRDIMGLAVSTDELAAAQLLHEGPHRAISVPVQPVWMSVPNAALTRGAKGLPAGPRLVASALNNADEVLVTLGMQGLNFAARLEAQCKSQQDAVNLANQLKALTSLMKGVLDHQKHKPDPNDFTTILTAGAFRQSNKTVYGEWTVQKSFLEHLASGM